MKKLIIILLCSIAFNADAQFLGGSGKGGVSRFSKLTYINPVSTAIHIIAQDTLYVNINSDAAKTYLIDWGNTQTTTYNLPVGGTTIYHVYTGKQVVINRFMVNSKMLTLYAEVNSPYIITATPYSNVVGWTAWIQH